MAKSARKEFAMNDEGLGEDVLSILDGMEALPDAAAPELSGLEAQVDEVVQGLSGARAAARVFLIDARQLEPYPNQPFKLYGEERMRDLAEDIKRVGILSPILARRNGKKLQILAGHNRWHAAKLAGLSEVPVLIVEADDDQAILVVTSTNLRQRERLHPSEKAFAYKLQMEALKRQGKRADESYRAADLITEQTGDSRIQIHRYVRLADIAPGLLELVDKGRIAMTPAVSLSYLSRENQEKVLELCRDHGGKLTVQRANKLREMELARADGRLSDRELDELFFSAERDVKREEKFRLSYNRLRDYLPPHANAAEAEMWIIRALEAYNGRKARGTLEE